MKIFILFLVVLFSKSSMMADEGKCGRRESDIPTFWMDMRDDCVKPMRHLIQIQIDTCFIYLSMGEHFLSDDVNRPGFAHHALEAASDKRDNAKQLIKYLIKRGELGDSTDLIKLNSSLSNSWKTSGIDALRTALELEARITKATRYVMEACDNDNLNDKHVLYYLTNDYLDDLYTNQRLISGHISSLDKLMNKHGSFGEFLFDKKMLE